MSFYWNAGPGAAAQEGRKGMIVLRKGNVWKKWTEPAGGCTLLSKLAHFSWAAIANKPIKTPSAAGLEMAFYGWVTHSRNAAGGAFCKMQSRRLEFRQNAFIAPLQMDCGWVSLICKPFIINDFCVNPSPWHHCCKSISHPPRVHFAQRNLQTAS